MVGKETVRDLMEEGVGAYASIVANQGASRLSAQNLRRTIWTQDRTKVKAMTNQWVLCQNC